ncbi:AfsR/SARP family transcriptional regulator [Hamadaea tsunoensis]|uniref:AfsR/SARP family transcriptional regulator n=1 Tax=Hamadaea tsunoensis TaxID=53368 RepID=UPI0003FE32A7|nr:BTAD domain-containing putative transcriptional regulator [Hamadaea tsunoensis]
MELRLLGPIEAEVDGRPVVIARRQERLLLAVLALEAGRLVPAARLESLLWPAGAPDGARQVVQTYLSRLRSALRRAGAHDGVIERRDNGYQLNVRPSDVDVHRFDELVRRALADPTPAGRAALLRTALELWRGSAFGDLSLHPTQTALRTGLDERRRRALVERIAADLALGRDADLVAEILAALAETPADERLIGLLMRAYAASGRREEALTVFHTARTRLSEELGVDPGPDLAAVHTAILRQEPAPSGSGTPPPAQLPRPVHPFVGREAELAALDELVRGAGPVVLHGPGGVGKTALAVRYAHDIAGRFPDGQLFIALNGYTGATEPTDPRTALREALLAFGVDDPPSDLSALTGRYRSTLSGRRVLVVLDNARTAEQVRPLLPHAAGCAVLVTSRSHLTGLAVTDSAASLPVAVLDDPDAARLLAARMGRRRADAEPEALGRLVSACAGLPLALSVVAARVTAKPAFPLLAFADEVGRPDRLLAAYTGDDLDSDLRTVLSWSYDRLSPAAATTFRLLGLPGGAHVTIEAADSLLGEGRGPAVRALRELEEASLLTEVSPGLFVLHDLLKAYAVELASAGPAPVAAVRRLLSHYLRTARAGALLVFPERPRDQLIDTEPGVAVPALPDRAAALDWFGRETAALVAAVELAAGHGLDALVIGLAGVTSEYFYRSGSVNEAIATLRAEAAAAERTGDLTRRGLALRSIANNYVRSRDAQRAIDHFLLALRCFTDDGDPALPASIHMGLAKAADQQGRHHDALNHALDALPLYHRSGNKRTICRALNTVGFCHTRTGDYEAALEYCTEALELSAAVDDPHGVAAIWDSLGHVHRGLGDFDAAREAFTRAIDMYAELDDLYQQADSLTGLGDSEEAAGRIGAAERHRRQAADFLDQLGHPAAAEFRATLQGRR